MKNYKEKKQIKRFVKTNKPANKVSAGDLLMQKYHEHEEKPKRGIVFINAGEGINYTTGRTTEVSSWNDPSWVPRGNIIK
jgi:hypothetical protein